MPEAFKGPLPKNDGPSSRNKQDSGSELSADERLAFLVEKGIRVLRENWRENIQEKGHKRYFVAFNVPETDHEARLILSQETRLGPWRLSVGVARTGSPRQHSHFLCHGEGQEGLDKVLAYLDRPELKTELFVSVKELSHHVDQDDYD